MASSSTSPTDVRVQQLRAQADAAANRGCPFAQNLVAQEIKSIVDSYRATAANPGATETLRYVTILGGDTVVPFFRYPDQSLLGQESGYFPPTKSDSISEASLRRDYVLSQDAYGAGTTIDIRTTAFPIPDLGGRPPGGDRRRDHRDDQRLHRDQRRRVARAPASSPATTS